MSNLDANSFNLPSDAQVLVCARVRSGEPVRRVFHDTDGTWQFLCGDAHGDEGEDLPELLELGLLLGRDPSLTTLSDLPAGHGAQREAPDAPWSRHDRVDDEIREAIEEYGFAIQVCAATAEMKADYAYTIGLWSRFEHPELIITGLPLEIMEDILEQCGDRIAEGRPIRAGEPLRSILERLALSARRAEDPIRRAALMPYAVRFHGHNAFPLLQILWPDKRGKLPGEPGVSPALAKHQPLVP